MGQVRCCNRCWKRSLRLLRRQQTHMYFPGIEDGYRKPREAGSPDYRYRYLFLRLIQTHKYCFDRLSVLGLDKYCNQYSSFLRHHTLEYQGNRVNSYIHLPKRDKKYLCKPLVVCRREYRNSLWHLEDIKECSRYHMYRQKDK